MDKVFNYVYRVFFKFQYGGRLDVEKIVIVFIDGILVDFIYIWYILYWLMK